MEYNDAWQDMNNFYEQYKSVQPYLQKKDGLGATETLQSPADRKKLVKNYSTLSDINN